MKNNILLLLLDKEFYATNKHKVVPAMFPDEIGDVYKTICLAHDKYKRNLTLDEVQGILFANNPALTRAQRHNYNVIFAELKECKLVGKDVAADILASLWREEIGRQIAGIGVDISLGKKSVTDIEEVLKKVDTNFNPVDEIAPITTDVAKVLEALDNRASWVFNIPDLSKKVPGISPGELGIIFARPEIGKTAFWVNMCFGVGGFASQGANIHVIANEEPAIRTMMRIISSHTGMTKDEIRADVKKAQELFKPVKDRIKLIDDVDMTIDKLNAYCKRHKPDVLILDQLDKIKIPGSFAREDQELGEIYVSTREIAKRHNVAVVGLSQASAEAEGKTQVHYSMLAGSKTSKAAEADLIVGIGKSDNSDIDDPTRSIFVSKNKLSGWRGLVWTVINTEVSRYK